MREPRSSASRPSFSQAVVSEKRAGPLAHTQRQSQFMLCVVDMHFESHATHVKIRDYPSANTGYSVVSGLEQMAEINSVLTCRGQCMRKNGVCTCYDGHMNSVLWSRHIRVGLNKYLNSFSGAWARLQIVMCIGVDNAGLSQDLPSHLELHPSRYRPVLPNCDVQHQSDLRDSMAIQEDVTFSRLFKRLKKLTLKKILKYAR